MREARHWRPAPNGRIECCLCPHRCLIGEGRTGTCGVRVHQDGKLYSLVYGALAAVNIDPIEKKPLFHVLPGTDILSLGTVGCNLNCKFCQNCTLSRGDPHAVRGVSLSPEDAVRAAQAKGCPSIAFTYNEPTVFAEYAEDVAAAGRQAGLLHVAVTNGYVTQEALPDLFANIDAGNVDLKAFTEDFYRKWTQSELQPVLDTLIELRRRGVWVEVTNLVIPGLNDSEAELTRMCEWILENLGDRVPLHFSAFHPDHELLDRPPTPSRTLRRARQLAREVGLKYVYLGNVRDDEGSTTYCPECNGVLVARSWHTLRETHFDGDRCGHCGAETDFVLPVP